MRPADVLCIRIDKEMLIRERLTRINDAYPYAFTEARGRGFIHGLACRDTETAKVITRRCFEAGLIIETAGARDEVIKLIPALNISEAVLTEGLDLLEQITATLLNK